MEILPRTVLATLLAAACATAPGSPAAAGAGAAGPAAAQATGQAATAAAAPLAPFSATYDAWNKGRAAGVASMRLERLEGDRWRIDLDVTGNRGLARWVRLDIDQGTVFDVPAPTLYRPLRQETHRNALFMDKRVAGEYDWAAGVARWTGDLRKERQQPVPLEPGDMSGLLINLAIVRDAAPGRTLSYRFVDGGRVRRHDYAVAPEPERVDVDGLAYEALRVSRTNGGHDETIVWVAHGVPTPVRILQREDGADAIDLRLVAYEGVH